MIDNREDWHNRPIKYGLTEEDKAQIQAHYEQRTRERVAQHQQLAAVLQQLAEALQGVR